MDAHTCVHTRDARGYARVSARVRAHCYRVTHPGTLHPVRVRYKLERIPIERVQLRYFPIFRFDTQRASIPARRVSIAIPDDRDVAVPV
jgi:hypothetical protein